MIFKRNKLLILPYLYAKASIRSLQSSNRGTKIEESSVIDNGSDKALKVNFCRAQHGNFYQESPQLHNPFLEDYPLQRFLKRQLPKEAHKDISDDLIKFGDRIVGEITDLGWECDQQLPYLISQDSWGKRVDNLRTCHAWKCQRVISAEEGIVAIGYERQYNEWSRLYQISKIYLYAPAAGLYTCPLAMTDGAAKTIENVSYHNDKFQDAFKRLTTRNSEKFWTSGQWMTERKGGSDIAQGTETIAVPDKDFYRLYGYKWFSSASDADMALALARIVNPDGSIVEGSKGLTMFYVETRDEQKFLNNIEMVRLKNKLGTRQVPTAELLLDGTVAHQMSEKGHGVAMISNMLNITRIHNAVASVAVMRLVLRLARDYSQRRYAFGEKIGNFPLHMQTLARMEIEVRGCLLLLLQVAVWLGNIECSKGTDEISLLLRLMCPVLKLYTAKQAMSIVSEGLEAFGGQGYMEDSRLPLMLRDAQVLPIWEGTTNILSLDLLRSISKTNGEVLSAFQHSIVTMLSGVKNKKLSQSCVEVEKSAYEILHFAKTKPEHLITAARDFAFSVAKTYIGALLIENASLADFTTEDIVAAIRWCERDMCPIIKANEASCYSDDYIKKDFALVMEGYKT